LGGDDEDNARVVVRIGSTEIDITGSQSEVSAELLELEQDEAWSGALLRLRTVRDAAIAAAVAAAEEQGLPERGSAFRALLDNCRLTRKPDLILAAIHYMREVESVADSPPRAVKRLFIDAGFTEGEIANWNISLYINRLREQGRLTIPQDRPEKNRFAVLTDGGRALLDSRASE